MSRSIPRACGAILLAAVSTLVSPSALAQAKPATDNKTLGGKPAPAGGKVMSKDELRSCLKRQDELAKGKGEIDSQSAVLESERQALLKEADAVKADQAGLNSRNEAARDFNNRMKAFAAEVQVWNDKVKAFNESGKKGTAAETEKAELEKQKGELDKKAAAFEAERTQLGAGSDDGSVKASNDRAGALNAKTDEWNTRNRDHQKRAETHEDARALWTDECGGRRYREDDEKALKAGK
jgi:DNA repair exonuclease SbcCD ATPase subunit